MLGDRKPVPPPYHRACAGIQDDDDWKQYTEHDRVSVPIMPVAKGKFLTVLVKIIMF